MIIQSKYIKTFKSHDMTRLTMFNSSELFGVSQERQQEHNL